MDYTVEWLRAKNGKLKEMGKLELPGTLKAPRSQTPNLIKLSDLKREQAKDADLSELRELLEAQARGEEVPEGKVRNFEIYKDKAGDEAT